MTGAIYLQRHAEKDDNADGADDRAHALSDKGVKRAKAIRDLGLFIKPRPDLGIPTYVFASGPPPSRMVETAKYTADVLKLPIDASLDSEKAIDATAKLLVAKANAGHTVWAILEHSAIPAVLKAIAKLLGCKDKIPSSHADADFATGYAFKAGRFSTWQQSVLPGDPGYVKPAPPPVTPPVVPPPPGKDPAPVPPVVAPPAQEKPPVVTPTPEPPPVSEPMDPAPTWPTPSPTPPNWVDRLLDWFKRVFSR